MFASLLAIRATPETDAEQSLLYGAGGRNSKPIESWVVGQFPITRHRDLASIPALCGLRSGRKPVF